MRMMKPAVLALCLILQPALAITPALAETAARIARITVTGEGSVETRPDMAVISLGVTSAAKTAAGAMAANSTQLGAVLASLKSAGIADRDLQTSGLSLNPVSFGVADEAPLRDEARKRAVADARHKADLLSEAAGVSLGAVTSISENGDGGGPAPQFRRAAALMAEAVPVAEGEVSLSASVTVVWELRP